MAVANGIMKASVVFRSSFSSAIFRRDRQPKSPFISSEGLFISVNCTRARERESQFYGRVHIALMGAVKKVQFPGAQCQVERIGITRLYLYVRREIKGGVICSSKRGNNSYWWERDLGNLWNVLLLCSSDATDLLGLGIAFSLRLWGSLN